MTLDNRPNFLIFVADQHPWDHLGCSGHPVLQTPNIDRLASEGVRFDRCYTVHPLCMPTRATWFTGQTPRGHGTRCNGIPLDERIPTVTEALRRAGYATHSVGKIHLRPLFLHRRARPDDLDPAEWAESRAMWDSGRVRRIPSPYYGLESADFLGASGNAGRSDYSRWLEAREPEGMRLMSAEASVPVGRGPERVWPMALPGELHFTRWMVECAREFLNRRAEDGRPFFLWWSCPDPHPPYAAPEPWCRMYDPADMPLPRRRPDELDGRPPHYRDLFERGLPTAGRIAPTNVPDDLLRRVRAMVCGMIGQLDGAVGEVLGDLERLGLAEDTVVVFTADHGQMLGDHWMLNMPPCHLDGTLRVPSIWRLPRQSNPGSVSRALVSHLDFAPTVLELAGVAPLEGPVPPEPEAPGNLPALPGRSLVPILRDEAASVQDSVVAEDDEDYLGLRLRTLVTEDHLLTVYPGRPYGELYDLRQDPDQYVNLWDEPGYRTRRLELQATLLDRLGQTDRVLFRRLCHA